MRLTAAAVLPYPNPLPARLLSLAAAIALSGLVLIWPAAFTGADGQVGHGGLTAMMWGIAAGFVHGVGFVPRLALWRLAFHPLLAWGLMALAAVEVV